MALAFIGAIDFAWQKYDYIKSLRMSHQDIKDEYKETDGQPEVKQKKLENYKCLLQQKVRKENASIDNLDEATAIITNPTHFAVALKYEVGDSKAPVIAKEEVKNAEKIIDKAKNLISVKWKAPY